MSDLIFERHVLSGFLFCIIFAIPRVTDNSFVFPALVVKAMVDLGGGVLQHSFDNSIFIAPAVILLSLVGFVTYKLVSSLRQKQKKNDDKKKSKKLKK